MEKILNYWTTNIMSQDLKVYLKQTMIPRMLLPLRVAEIGIQIDLMLIHLIGGDNGFFSSN